MSKNRFNRNQNQQVNRDAVSNTANSTSSPSIQDQGVNDTTLTSSVADTQNKEPEVTTANVETNTNTTPETDKVANPIVTETRATEPTEIEAYFESIRKDGAPELKNLLLALEQYAINMAPGKPVPTEAGAKHQYGLWRAIYSVTLLPMDKFRKAWNLLLAFSLTNRVFELRYIFRFSEYWTWSTDELDAFQRIINLIKLTAKPDERQIGLKQVSLDRTLEKGFTQEAKQNIIAFYH